jgi:hypothetical protein
METKHRNCNDITGRWEGTLAPSAQIYLRMNKDFVYSDKILPKKKFLLYYNILIANVHKTRYEKRPNKSANQI